LVEVSLKRNTAEAHQEFQSKIQDISGVIEWDKISGIIDYLVRIATPIDLDGQAIKDKIQGIDCVRDVKGSTYTVTRSGIVDNITADMFLSFQVESS
jgi:hypothetical protein